MIVDLVMYEETVNLTEGCVTTSKIYGVASTCIDK